jgi:CDP-4-dehydro-6-deoxyglucose reductase, E3
MRKKATVRARRALSPSVCALTLAPEGGLSFVPGQWVNVFVPSPGGELKRAYSIASAPHDPELELAITRVEGGAASPLIHALEPGSELWLDGPHGFFTRDGEAAEAPALLVATGTGIAPFRSMLRALGTSGRASPPVRLLFGCRSEADALYAEELRALTGRIDFGLEVTLSRPPAGYTGRTGHVQAHLVSLARSLGQPHVYVCGLSRMVTEVRALCKGELGLDRHHIHTERYDP